MTCSPLIQGGLELQVAKTNYKDVMEISEQLVEKQYEEPVSGKVDDITCIASFSNDSSDKESSEKEAKEVEDVHL